MEKILEYYNMMFCYSRKGILFLDCYSRSTLRRHLTVFRGHSFRRHLSFFDYGPSIGSKPSIRTLVPVFQLMANTGVGSIFIEGLGRKIHVHRIYMSYVQKYCHLCFVKIIIIVINTFKAHLDASVSS